MRKFIRFIAGLLIIYGILQLIAYFYPNSVFTLTGPPPKPLVLPTPQPAVATCNGQVMSPGDVCDVYENGVLVRTDTYEERLAAAQADAQAPIQAAQAAHDSAEATYQLAVTLTQPNSYIFGVLALVIGLLLLLATSITTRLFGGILKGSLFQEVKADVSCG